MKGVKKLRSTTSADIFFFCLGCSARLLAIHKQDGGHLRNRKTRTNTSAGKADDSACTATAQRNSICSDIATRHNRRPASRASALTHVNSSDKHTNLWENMSYSSPNVSYFHAFSTNSGHCIVNGTLSSSRC